MRLNKFLVGALAMVAALAVSGPVFADDDDDDDGGGRVFEVTVTNITRGQVFTPILVASHREGVRLFRAGEPASDALETVAEQGDVSLLADLLRGTPGVLDVTDSGAVLPPGESVTIRVAARGSARYVSLAAMLIPTNDGFVALNGVRGPSGGQTATFRMPGYDAGTEPNDELCANIPGPPDVCTGEGVDLEEDGEGFVHIHSGIRGIGDLGVPVYDWRNPVADIRIRRTR